MVFGRGRPRIELFAAAVAGALAFVADGRAQVFDPNSPAVREAYVGPATPAKIAAALTGLNTTSSVTQTLFGSFVSVSGSFSFDSFRLVSITADVPLNFGSTFVFAASDADLGAPGAVDLTLKRLEALAGFTTARDFTVGSSTINTNAFNLTLDGAVTANGVLVKEGSGILTLNGANVWNGNTIHLFGGTLRGSAASLGTNIAASASTTIELNQGIDGVYASQMSGGGSLVKNGPAKLTVSAFNSLGGEVRIDQGTLALSGAGSFGSSSALKIQNGATLDIAAAGGTRAFGALSGSGSIVLGANTLETSSSTSTTFGGTISGSGAFAKSGG